MFFHRCSYKNSRFSELVYKSSVLVMILLMIWSMKFKNYVVILKRLLWILIVLLVLKLCSIQLVISLPWIKLPIKLFFLWDFSSFFNYVRGILVTNHCSLLLNDRYILGIQQIIKHEEHLWYSFCSNLLNCLRSLTPWS